MIKIGLKLLITISLLHSAHGLLIGSYSVDLLRSKATLIVKGKISKITVKSERGRFYTRYELNVSDLYLFRNHSMKSEVASPISKVGIHLPGGERNGLAQSVRGIPKLERLTDYLFFLRCPSVEQCVPLGYGQGVWVRDQSSGLWSPLDPIDSDQRMSLKALTTLKGQLNESLPRSPQVEAQP